METFKKVALTLLGFIVIAACVSGLFQFAIRGGAHGNVGVNIFVLLGFFLVTFFAIRGTIQLWRK